MYFQSERFLNCTNIFIPVVASDVYQLLDRIRRHELQLWTLIEDQHALKTCINRINSETLPQPNFHSLSQLLDSLSCIVDQYEACTWQVVPLQMHIRLKLVEWSNMEAKSVAQVENVDLDIGNENFVEVDEEKPLYTVLVVVEDGAVHEKPTQATEKPSGRLETSHNENLAATKRPSRPRHEAAPGKRKKYPCSNCERVLSSLANLTAHEHKMHGGAIPYQCKLCTAQFKVRSKYYEHKQQHINAGDRYDEIHECRVCRAEFNLQKELLEHFGEQHAGAKPFACDECGEQCDAR